MSNIETKSADSANEISPATSISQFRRSLDNFWQFSRPHTIIGTSLSVLCLYLMTLSVVPENAINYAPELWQLAGTWIACLCGNIYIVGLNQLEDVEIDRINKPYLPIASGEFSRRQGQVIVAITGILALLIAGLMGKILLAMVTISLAIGTAYSLPPFRLKRFPVWAAFCIFTVRGTVVNLGLFLHFSSLWQYNQFIPAEIWALTLFIVAFTLAIAISKDIPDVEGDRQYNIATFTIQLGTQTTFNLVRWLLTACYLGLILAGIVWLTTVNPWFLGISHLFLLGLMWWRSSQVDLGNKSAIASFYQFIWKLFFLEYLLFPLICLYN
jgi:homogentisate phytyltransferase/homogentisate geranylgeranyltransferase